MRLHRGHLETKRDPNADIFPKSLRLHRRVFAQAGPQFGQKYDQKKVSNRQELVPRRDHHIPNKYPRFVKYQEDNAFLLEAFLLDGQ